MSAGIEMEWPINAFDSREHAVKVEEYLEKQVPGVSCAIICDPEEIAAVVGRPAPEGQVLIRLIPPVGKRPDVYAAWVKCPEEPMAIRQA